MWYFNLAVSANSYPTFAATRAVIIGMQSKIQSSESRLMSNLANSDSAYLQEDE